MQAYFGSVVFNKFVWKQSVRYEDIRTVFDLFLSGYFFFTFDLKSGYHHIEIFPDHRQYLGFSWRFDSVVKYFVFPVLPFGLSSAPYIFTKLQYRSNVSYHLLERRVSLLSRRVSFLSRRVSFHSSHFSFLASALQVPMLCIVVTHKANVRIQ